MGSRYYDPETMNFIQKDSILGEEERPETLNRYGYVQGNPILYEDPEGRSAVFAFGGIAMAAYQATKTIFKKQAQAKTIAETLQNPLQSSMVRNKNSSISSSKQVIAAGSGKLISCEAATRLWGSSEAGPVIKVARMGHGERLRIAV